MIFLRNAYEDSKRLYTRIKKLNESRNKDFDSVEIDWYGKGGVTIDQLANQFD